ncbi:MAG: hypothetical protein C4320_04690 [Armatimonadota bacterium]
MSVPTMNPPAPSSVKRYWTATRPYSFTAAAVPVLIGSLLAVAVGSASFSIVAFALTLIGAVAIQSVANVVNDLYDRRTGIDREDNYGRFNSFVAEVVTESEGKRIIGFASAVALAIAIWFILRVGAPAVSLIVMGALLAFFYTAPPFRLKHYALGDAAVAAGFGFGMLYGAFLAQLPATTPWQTLIIYTLPSLLLVVGILHANNHRDRVADLGLNARTVANLLSERGSAWLNSAYLLLPYALVIVGVATKLATPFWLLTLLSFPIALKLHQRGQRGDVEGMYVPEVAKLHGLFGILTAVAIGVSLLFHKG